MGRGLPAWIKILHIGNLRRHVPRFYTVRELCEYCHGYQPTKRQIYAVRQWVRRNFEPTNKDFTEFTLGENEYCRYELIEFLEGRGM